jgi:hypothetical protein
MAQLVSPSRHRLLHRPQNPAWLDSLGLQHVAGEGNTAHFNGGSDWATYWAETMRELAPSLLKLAHVTQELLGEFRPLPEPPFLDQRHHLHRELVSQTERGANPSI